MKEALKYKYHVSCYNKNCDRYKKRIHILPSFINDFMISFPSNIVCIFCECKCFITKLNEGE